MNKGMSGQMEEKEASEEGGVVYKKTMEATQWDSPSTDDDEVRHSSRPRPSLTCARQFVGLFRRVAHPTFPTVPGDNSDQA